MKTQHIREEFLGYFEKNGHKIVKSSLLLPKDDPTILFTNAGMNQFKNLFSGLEKRSYTRAASVQKCMRVSGKHNDLETVGRTNKHHTFFEMLGNFSFGDYFKEEAIRFGWEFITEVLKLSKQRIYVTVYLDDDEAYDIWHKQIGVSEDRIFRFGKKDNFWAMGDTGPCGPCSEIHYDIGTASEDEDVHRLIESGSDRVVELWNLVFMQFYQDEQGRQSPLPSPSIDTGMGLERLAAVLQNKNSNYSTDLFFPIIEAICEITEKEYPGKNEDDVSIRIIADHIRAVSFLIGDGIMPANDGRGYVLRRLIRRAYRRGNFLGLEDPFLYKIVGVVADVMKDTYPEMLDSSEYISKMCLSEEKRFSKTLSSGLRTFNVFVDEAKAARKDGLSGKQVFKLYDTFGFPLDLSKELASEINMTVDEKGFDRELEDQRKRARLSWRGDGSQKEMQVYMAFSETPTEFLGYDTYMISDSEVVGLIRNGKRVDRLEEGDEGEILLARTPFYAESGGQVGDTGIMKNPHFSAIVKSTNSPIPALVSHGIEVLSGHVEKGDLVDAEINRERRQNIARNHTATHLLHAALRAVLGDHVRQAGSLVASERIRFDFTHFNSLSIHEIEQVESIINEKIRDNVSLNTAVVSLDEGIKMGAMSIFEEKYGETVRMVTVPGFSRELCGGSHVHSTGEIGLFEIISESSIAAGMRRIEALTGGASLKKHQADRDLLTEIQRSLNANRTDIMDQILRLKELLKEAEKEQKSLRRKLAGQRYSRPEEKVRRLSGVPVVAQKVEVISNNDLRDLADSLKHKMGSAVVVLGAALEKKAFLAVSVSKDLTGRVRADDLIRAIAPVVGGGGGGRPDFAQAGGSMPDKLDEALEQSLVFLEKILAD